MEPLAIRSGKQQSNRRRTISQPDLAVTCTEEVPRSQTAEPMSATLARFKGIIVPLYQSHVQASNEEKARIHNELGIDYRTDETGIIEYTDTITKCRIDPQSYERRYMKWIGAQKEERRRMKDHVRKSETDASSDSSNHLEMPSNAEMSSCVPGMPIHTESIAYLQLDTNRTSTEDELEKKKAELKEITDRLKEEAKVFMFEAISELMEEYSQKCLQLDEEYSRQLEILSGSG